MEMINGGAGQLSRIKRMVLAVVMVFLVFFIFSMFVVKITIIEPGYTGIRINKLVNQGVSKENIITGYVVYMPLFTSIVKYPTFVQRVAWTHDVGEGNPHNEELTFNTVDSVPVDMDVAVSYQLEAEKVPDFYTKFRADDIMTFTHGFLRDTTRNIVAKIGSEYTFDVINGAKKEEFLSRIATELNTEVKGFGVSIQQFGLIGSLRPPQELLNAVNAKTRAIQLAIQTENEIRSAQAEAKKRIAIAEGDAAANKALASSLDPKLLEWERLKIEKGAIAKWDGKMPSVMSGNSSGMMFNIPVPTK
ncbi:MAG: SPFH domain-containing protein [Desulfobacteraceae bacterium]|nr:SPFH domain-containing protein [Desulfobacteraceae bacterium]